MGGRVVALRGFSGERELNLSARVWMLPRECLVGHVSGLMPKGVGGTATSSCERYLSWGVVRDDETAYGPVVSAGRYPQTSHIEADNVHHRPPAKFTAHLLFPPPRLLPPAKPLSTPTLHPHLSPSQPPSMPSPVPSPRVSASSSWPRAPRSGASCPRRASATAPP